MDSGSIDSLATAGAYGECRMVKIGRNDPCPCGSGKKYKQCHGRTMMMREAEEEQDESDIV